MASPRDSPQCKPSFEEMMGTVLPSRDGDDYKHNGKYRPYKRYLDRVRDLPISEEAKIRRTNLLKEEVIPFWHRCSELADGEAEELKAVFLNYNGPESIRQRYKQEYDEMKARIAASEDADLLQDMDQSPAPCGPSGSLSFSYSGGGSIVYRRMWRELQNQEKGGSEELPVINIVPLGAGNGIPHHNMNPDDDLCLNHTLLKLLHRLMEYEDAAPFINFDDEERQANYYYCITKPRWLKFIEQGLLSDASLGYGATAFFNDMLLLVSNMESYYECVPYSEIPSKAKMLKWRMKQLLKEMGSVGQQLMTLCRAIEEQGVEDWQDPEIICFQEPHRPRFPAYDGSKPDENTIKARAWDQLQRGQQRVRELRRRMALKASNITDNDHTPAAASEAPLNQEPRKRTHEESAEPDEDGPSRGPKRQRSINSTSICPSKRPREPTVDDDDEYGREVEPGEAADSRAAKRQRMTEAVAPFSLPATSCGGPEPGSDAAPPEGSASERARTPADLDIDDDDQGNGHSHGPSGSKRRRLRKDKSSSGLPAASPEPGPSTTTEATNEPAAQDVGSSQAQESSAAAGQSVPPQPLQQVPVPGAPSSQPLPSSRNTVAMSKITKKGKTRPWVFGYSTDEGYGLYAFMQCPGQNCRQHFTTNPLKDNRARDHLLGCNQPILNDQDMVRQYASQVIKDTGRKSDLTVDWARKSNMTLLPSNQKDNHPDNFPLSAAGQ